MDYAVSLLDKRYSSASKNQPGIANLACWCLACDPSFGLKFPGVQGGVYIYMDELMVPVFSMFKALGYSSPLDVFNLFKRVSNQWGQLSDKQNAL